MGLGKEAGEYLEVVGGNEIKTNNAQSKHLWGGENVQSRARTAIPG